MEDASASASIAISTMLWLSSFHSERNHQGNMMRQDKKRGRRRSCEEVLNALATFHRLRYAYERRRTHLTARTFAQWSVSRVLATCPVAMCSLAPTSVHWGFVVLQARAPATTSTTSRICYCRGKPIDSAHRQCLFGSVATLSQGSTSRAHRVS